MPRLFALQDTVGIPAAESCLCEDHFTDVNKFSAARLTKMFGAGRLSDHPQNEVIDFRHWHEVIGWPNMECVACHCNAKGDIRPPGQDYNPYDR